MQIQTEKTDAGLFAGDDTCHVEVPPEQRRSERGNLTQFGIKHLLLMVFSFSISLGIREWIPGLGTTFLVLLLGFWVGYGLLVASDLIDGRAFEERNLVSSTLAATGIFFVAGFGGMAVTLFCACVAGMFIQVVMG